MSSADQPIRGVKDLTIDTVCAKGRTFMVNCTVAGNVSITFSDDSTHIFPIVVGYSVFPYSVKKFNTTGTTATATYSIGI
jgi:hypothetical protein